MEFLISYLNVYLITTNNNNKKTRAYWINQSYVGLPKRYQNNFRCQKLFLFIIKLFN